MLSGILHNWSRPNAEAILRQCGRALPQGGLLLISEQLLNNNKAGPTGATLCSLNMLVMMEGAQEYSQAEYAAMLVATGFSWRRPALQKGYASSSSPLAGTSPYFIRVLFLSTPREEEIWMFTPRE